MAMIHEAARAPQRPHRSTLQALARSRIEEEVTDNSVGLQNNIMRQKRAKVYRKLLHKYALHFKFREPYQVLMDSTFTMSLSKQKIDEGDNDLADRYNGRHDTVQERECSCVRCKDDMEPEPDRRVSEG